MKRPDWLFVSDHKTHTQDGPQLVKHMKDIGAGNRKVLTLDIGCGDGIITKELFDFNKTTHAVAIDIQSSAIKAATANLKTEMNLKKVDVLKISAQKYFKIKNNIERFDNIVINPPFFVQGSGESNKNSKDQIARHEAKLKMKVWVKGAAKLLKYGGELYCVFPTERLAELISELVKNKLEPKDIWWQKTDKRKRRFFLRAKRGAKPGVMVHQD